MAASALRATRPARAATSTRRTVPSPLHPLDLAYTRAGLEPPAATPIAPEKIPQPYRSLLVHQRDMTLTLEAHFGGRVVLRPLSTFISGPGTTAACSSRRSIPAGRSRWARSA